MKKMNKKDTQIYQDYLSSNKFTLDDAYNNYSYHKEVAYNRIKTICAENNGVCVKIISHNSQIFTAGFMAKENGYLCLYYFTPYSFRKIVIHN